VATVRIVQAFLPFTTSAEMGGGPWSLAELAHKRHTNAAPTRGRRGVAREQGRRAQKARNRLLHSPRSPPSAANRCLPPLHVPRRPTLRFTAPLSDLVEAIAEPWRDLDGHPAAEVPLSTRRTVLGSVLATQTLFSASEVDPVRRPHAFGAGCRLGEVYPRLTVFGRWEG
jgi:hypothetical protein